LFSDQTPVNIHPPKVAVTSTRKQDIDGILFGENMKLIPLTSGQFAKVDDDEYDELIKMKCSADWNNKTKSFYAKCAMVVDGKYKRFRMHRIIMKTPPEMKCDHRDHDTLNNQKYNLRNCTNSQNMMNRKGAASQSKTGVLGVSPYKGQFRVFISHPETHENMYLGKYKTLEEAADVRKAAEIEYYGEFRNVDSPHPKGDLK